MDYSDRNPFTPSFGEVPAHLAGRQDVLRALRRAFSSTIRRPEHTLLITGARGTGKTAMLSVAAEDAQARGWIAVNAVSVAGMLEDIAYQTERLATHLVETDAGPRVSGFGVGNIIHLDFEQSSQERNWRSHMSDLLDALANVGVGLLITVDEVQPQLDEMVQLAAVYQLFVREQRRVALLMAGLPHNISALIQDKSVSFLRRAHMCRLGPLADVDVESAFRRSVEDAGRAITQPALEIATVASEGFPFMMQLVGYHAWEMDPTSSTIGIDAVDAGRAIAQRVMREQVLEATYASLSNGDRRFLHAMLEDGEKSAIGDIAGRMGKTTAYATQYKRRLMEQGVIGERGRGYVGFELPLMRDYVADRVGEA